MNYVGGPKSSEIVNANALLCIRYCLDFIALLKPVLVNLKKGYILFVKGYTCLGKAQTGLDALRYRYGVFIFFKNYFGVRSESLDVQNPYVNIVRSISLKKCRVKFSN